MATRRKLVAGGGVAALAAVAGWGRFPGLALAQTRFEVQHTEAEWRRLLPADAFAVLREQATEYPGSSPLDHLYQPGNFLCRGCDLPLFSSKTKFDSHTGWPSFWQPLPNAVSQRQDLSFSMDRTEVHCRRCGGHLGHVFDDGPRPTGLRYCMNGVALTFRPA